MSNETKVNQRSEIEKLRKNIKFFSEVVKPKERDIHALFESINNLDKQLNINEQLNLYPFLLLTAATSGYRDVTMNWIYHINRLNYQRYIVICFDDGIYQQIGPLHAVRMYLPDTKRRPSRSYTAVSSTYSKPSTNKAFKKYSKASKKLPPQSIRQQQSNHYSRIRQLQSIRDESYSYGHNYNHMNRFLRTKHNINPKEYQFDRNLSSSYGSNDHMYSSLKTNESLPDGFRTRHLPFSVMMLFKYVSIYELLRLNIPVLWSDTDSVWIKSCTIKYICEHIYIPNDHQIDYPTIKDAKNHHSHPSPLSHQLTSSYHIDILAQKGKTPKNIYERYGSCICTGFILMNPTNLCGGVIYKVIRGLIHLSYGLAMACDQTLFNEAVESLGGFKLKVIDTYDMPRSHRNEIQSSTMTREAKVQLTYNHKQSNATTGSTGLHNPSVEYTGNEFITSKSFSSFHNSHHRQRGLPSFQLDRKVGFALLPYAYCPRGDVIIPKQVRIDRKKQRNYQRAQRQSKALALDTKKLLNRMKLKSNEHTVAAYNRTVKPFHIDHADQSNTTSSSAIHTNEINKPEERYINEWNQYKADACLWHMVTGRGGNAKLRFMQQSGVFNVSFSETEDIFDDLNDDDADAYKAIAS